MPGRKYFAGSGYRYGFNGKENDDNTCVGNLDFGARVMDVRLGRWMSIDLKTAKYPYLTPYNFVANNPVNAIDPDGKDIIFLIAIAEKKANSKNNMFIKSAETRKMDIESNKGFNSQKDVVVILQVQDLSKIKELVNQKVKELSPQYGRTTEVGIYSHNGEDDGPIGTEDLPESQKGCAKDYSQMLPECWGKIDWSWKTSNKNNFILYGCNAAKNDPDWDVNFTKTLSNQPNLKDVLVSGLEVSTYPSLYTDTRTYTPEMQKGDFSKVNKIYMVGSDG